MELESKEIIKDLMNSIDWGVIQDKTIILDVLRKSGKSLCKNS